MMVPDAVILIEQRPARSSTNAAERLWGYRAEQIGEPVTHCSLRAHAERTRQELADLRELKFMERQAAQRRRSASTARSSRSEAAGRPGARRKT